VRGAVGERKRERTRKPQAPVARVCETHVRDTEARGSDSPPPAAVSDTQARRQSGAPDVLRLTESQLKFNYAYRHLLFCVSFSRNHCARTISFFLMFGQGRLRRCLIAPPGHGQGAK